MVKIHGLHRRRHVFTVGLEQAALCQSLSCRCQNTQNFIQELHRFYPNWPAFCSNTVTASGVNKRTLWHEAASSCYKRPASLGRLTSINMFIIRAAAAFPLRWFSCKPHRQCDGRGTSVCSHFLPPQWKDSFGGLCTIGPYVGMQIAQWEVALKWMLTEEAEMHFPQRNLLIHSPSSEMWVKRSADVTE